jgi:autotransporter-associated beta strand protein
MKKRLSALIFPLLLLAPSTVKAAFDLEAWKSQYGTALTPSAFYSTRPGPWGDYFSSTSVDCANATFMHLGPLGIKARPFDQALSTAVFAALYPAPLVDASGLIQNAFGVLDTPAGGPSDGKVYPGDVILEMEDQRIKTAADISFPFPIQSKSSRGLEIHAGQLVDAAEGRGAIKLKVLRAALTAYDGGTLTAPTTTTEVSLNVSGQDFVRLTTVSANNCLTNWINPRFEDGLGGVLYLNAQTIVQKCGYASPQMGKDATGATVFDGATTITNCIGTRSHSMIEYAVPAGYTTLKFKVQTTGTGSVVPSIKTRKTTIATMPVVPRQFDGNGAPVLAPELAPYLETIEYSIPQIGSFGSTYDPNSEKVANYASILAHRLATSQNADGSWPSGGGDYAEAHFRTALAGLGLLATGDPAYTTHIQKAATFVAANNPGGWAYPRGTRLMFLAEYYLRTKDAAILPGLQNAVNDAQEMITADFACGHGLNMGYGGAGYIGATGTVGTGLAIASKCPVIVDLPKLDNLLERVQELAGGNGGALPYSRGGIGRNAFPETPSTGQSYSCGAGGVLATRIRGGPQYITELFRKKFGAATSYGDADGGHASEALTFIMGSLACGIWGDDAHQANMNRFLWRLTLKRDFSGYINLNTNRLEYHGADGGVHGGPTYDTGGYLILLNNHKHNLAITGLPTAQAQVFPNIPPTYDVDRKLYWRVLGDWNMVDAALGSKMPASLQPKLAELRSMTLGTDLADRSLAFLQREGLAAATLVNAIPGLTSPERQHYCEMLLGIGHAITVASIDDPVPATGLSNYRFSVNGYNATSTWDSWGGPTPSSDPASTTQMTGTVTLTDPSGTYLATPRVLNFTPTSLNPTTDFQVPVSQQVNMTATFNYTVGGSLPISYTRDIIINPAVPFNVDSRAGNYTNVRKVWIPGNCPIPFEKWNMPIQLPSGETLPGASKNEGTIGFHTYDNGVLVPADNTYKARIRGNPAGYWVISSDIWGECAALGVNVLDGPVLTTTAVSAINPSSATSGANITSDSGWPITKRGICWSTNPYPTIYDSKTSNGTATGSFTANLANLLPGTVYHVRAYATNAIGTAYGENLTFSTSGSSGTWTTAGSGSWSDTANWLNGTDASGADGVADFGTVTPPSDATITISGQRSIGGMVFGNGSFTGNWNLTGGTLSLDIGASGNPTVTVSGGAAVISTVLAGTDGLVKAGTGTLVLNASNIFTGITAVNAGTLQLGGVLSDGSPVTVGAGGTLTGTGTIGANTTVAGTLSPGISGIGTLNIEAALTLSGTTAMEINKTAATSDKVSGTSSLTYGGTLTVTNLAGSLAAGDTFTLFNASSYSGSFSIFNLPPLTGGLKWDTSKLAVNGSIQVGYDAAITGQPSNQSVGQGVSASFTVTATGIPAPTYQWQLSTNAGTSWTNITGATSATYATPPTVTGDNNNQFRCLVSNSLSSATSNAAVLSVTSNSLPSFTSQPANVILSAASQTASFTAVASGTPAPTYQWQVSTNAGGTWANVSGATSATYSFTAAAGDDNKAYRCVATNSQGSANSDMALLIIAAVPTWTNPLGGSWPTAANWFNNTIASGTGITADFSRLDLSGNQTVTLDGARTIGNLKFGDVTTTYGWTLATGSGGPLTLATSSGTPTITVNNGSATISTILAGTNGMSKTGAGNLILTAANTYAGGTTLSAGTLTINNASAIGGGVLTITGGILANTSGATIALTGNQAWNGNFTYAGPNNLTLSSPVTLNANRTLTVQGGDLTVNAAISGAFSLTKAGTNTLALGATNTFTGGLIVNAGTVSLQPGDYVAALPANAPVTINNGGTVLHTSINVTNNGTAFTVNAGGTLKLTSYHAHIAAITLNGGTILGTGSGKYASEDFALDGNLTVGGSSASTINIANGIGMGNRTFNVANVTGDSATDLTVTGSGALRGTGQLTKTGVGTLVFANQNSHSGGTVISTGTVRLDGGSLGSGAVSVAAGATLGGSGSIGGATTVAGALSPGNGSVIGSLTFSSNLGLTGTTTIKLAKAGGTITKDILSIGGTLTCGGTLTVTATGDALATGDTIQLFSASAISGTFATVNLPALSGGLVWDSSRLYIDGSISLGKIAQAITFPAISAMNVGDVIALDASASSGLVVTYTSSNPAVGLLQFGNYLTAYGAGTTTITSAQPGNAFYQAATDVSRTLTVSASLPAVQTVSLVPLTTTSATSGGTNIWDGGDPITERGVCWGTSVNPTVANSRTLDGTGTGNFTSTLTGLTGNITYHIRAYVKNSAGYSYGEDVAFNAPVDGVWILNANGNWSTAANWSGGLIPQGYGSTANFATLNITGDRTVTLDAAATLGAMTFGDVTTASHNWILAPGIGSLTMTALSGTPTITVNNQTATINTPIAGTMGLTKAGSGTLALGAYNPISGPISITSGIVRQTTNSTFAPESSLTLTNSALEVRYGSYNTNWVDVTSLTLGGGATLRAAAQYQIDNGDIGFKDNITVIGTNTVSATGGSYGKHNWLSGGMTGDASAYVNLTNGAGYGAYADRRAIILESFYGNWTGYQGTIRAVNDVTIKGSVELRNAKVIVDGTIGLYANGAIGEFGELSGAGTLEANAKTGGQWKIGNLGTNSTYAGVINGASQLTKAGTGSLILTNANTHTGGTTVSAGTLLANNSTGSATGTGTVAVASGATLGGAGIITGATSVAGTIAPGSNGIGTITINNTVNLTGATTLELNKTGATLTNDKVQGVTTLTYGGTLTVTASGDALTAGSTFTLFSATTYAGSFTSITLPTLASGLEWDTSSLGTNGSITIISTKPVVTVTATGTPAEAGPTSGQFIISRDLTAGALTVYFTPSGTATSGTDYATLPASVTFPDGAASASVTLTPVDDLVSDANETATLTLAGDAAYVIGTPDSATLTITDNDGPQPVGLPWTAQDVGSVASGNSSTVTNGGGANGTNLYSISGSGTLNQTTTTDGFHFVSMPVTGDCEITARVVTNNTSSTAMRAGVMIREANAANSRHAAMVVRGTTTSTAAWYIYRTATGGSSARTAGSNVAATYWVRLTLTGTSTVAAISADGTTWITVGTQNITMGSTPLVGLAVASGSTTATNTATFDNVTIKQNVVSISSPPSPAAEGTPVQNAAFTVSRGSNPPATALSIPLTLAGTATHATDYSFSGGSVSVVGATATVTIPSGQNSITLTTTPLNDLVNDDAETINLTVPAGTTYSLGTETTASTSITNAPVAALTTASAPAEGGTTSGSGTFYTGTTQPITATPASGWQFVNWTGTGITDSSNASTTVSIDAAKTVTANFVRITHALTVAASPVEGGSVTGAGTYNEGSTQPITATPASGWQFVNWTGTGITDSSNASTTVSIDAAKTVTANFVRITHALTVTASPAEGGSTTGAGTYNQGSTQPITATPASGWQLVNWTGTGITAPNSASTTVSIDAAKTITANFTQINPDANDNGILDEWEESHFGNANQGSNNPGADEEGDGLSNLLEYALDTHPLQPNASPLIHDIEPVGADHHLRLTVPKNPAATNLTYTVEVCGDLESGSWSSAQTVIEENSATLLRVRDTVDADTANRRFIRLKVSVNP